MMQRFDPRYWCVNFGTTAAASVIATGSNSLLVTCNFRTNTDLIGLYWYSTDTQSHTSFRYETNKDYSATTLDFDFVLSDNIRALDQVNAPTLTVNHADSSVSYVRLSNYVTSGNNQAGHIHLPFASVGGGWTATDPIDWTEVDSLMLSIVATTYDPSGGDAPLDPQQVGMITFSNISVTGPTLAQNTTALPAHTLRMTDGYDDSYPMTPTRFVEQMAWLGYRDWYSIYMGISHHHDLIWNADESRFVVNPADKIINDATTAWFRSLLAELHVNGFSHVIVSVSYEIVNYLMPTGWQQYDADGNPGESGWSPPSQFVTPCNTTALDYLVNVANAVFALFPSGLNRIIQVGEPWWWDNSFTNNEPCFYDGFTTTAYASETGLPVPTPLLTSTSQDVTGYEAFLSWLNGKLGDSTHYIADQVRLSYPDAQTALLFYTPQIFASTMMQAVNLPITSWSSPRWDILQVEDYDWIINAEWDQHATTWDTAETTLGYPVGHLHYFSGFNLLAADADTVWPNVFTAIIDGFDHNVAEVWVWARPEVFRDGIIWPQPWWTITSSLQIRSNGSGVGDVWMDNSYVDFDDETTRNGFQNSDGSWLFLGENGEEPTGSSPLNWLRVQTGNEPTDILYGYGQGGGQTGWFNLRIGDDPSTSAPYADMTFDECAAFFATLNLDDLVVTQYDPPPSQHKIWLRYSDDRGMSWSEPVCQELGAEGEWHRVVTWNRTGMSRDRVIELSWSIDAESALTGVWVDVTYGQT